MRKTSFTTAVYMRRTAMVHQQFNSHSASTCAQWRSQWDSSLILKDTMQVAAVAMLAVLMAVCVCSAVAMPQQPQLPQPNTDGGWRVQADKTRNDGTQVKVDANKQWDVSKDGNVKAEVHGHWDRTYGGPNNGQRDHGFGGSIGGSWG